MKGTKNPMVALAKGYQLQRAYAKIGKGVRRKRERAQAGTSTAAPMSHTRRREVYHAQTGAARMTPAQRRRYNKKLIAEMVRAGDTKIGLVG